MKVFRAAKGNINKIQKIFVFKNTGARGPQGEGFSSGGNTDQLIKKSSDADYDYEYFTLTKSFIGLGSVDNTSDDDKPISTAQQTALDGKIDKSLATAANDFLVASGVGVWVKKTIAEVKTLLGLGSAAFTDSGDYDPAGSASGVQTNLNSHELASNPHSGSAGSGVNSDITSLTGVTGNVNITEMDGASYFKTGTDAIVTPDPSFLAARTMTDGGGAGNGHAFADNTVFQRDTMSYNSFDARAIMSGTGFSFGHYSAFQSRPEMDLDGSETIDRLSSLTSDPIVNSGTVTDLYHVDIGETTGAGTVTNQYGVYIGELTKGATSDWAVYTVGATQSYFGGNVQLNAGIELPVSGTGKGARITNIATLDNFPNFLVSPDQSEANQAMGMRISPRGTGYSATIKSEFTLFNTDYVADSTNFENLLLRAQGTQYAIRSEKGGTGSYRPIVIQIGTTTRLKVGTDGIINISNTPTYADNAAAKTGGLSDGSVYRTATGALMIVYT